MTEDDDEEYTPSIEEVTKNKKIVDIEDKLDNEDNLEDEFEDTENDEESFVDEDFEDDEMLEEIEEITDEEIGGEF